MRKIKLQKIVGNLMDKLRKLRKWNGHLEILSLPQGIENSRQFLLLRTDISVTENCRWVPLHGPKGVHLSQRVDCNNKLVKNIQSILYTRHFYITCITKKNDNEPEETSPRGLSRRKKRQNLKFLSECYP